MYTVKNKSVKFAVKLDENFSITYNFTAIFAGKTTFAIVKVVASSF